MKRWSIGWNDYWFTTSLILYEASIPIVFLEWIMNWVCYLIYFIPWIGERFHLYAHDPINQFIWRHTKTTWIPLPYKFVQDTFPKEYKEFEKNEWDDPEDMELLKRNQKRMMQIYSQFMRVYKCLGKHELFFDNKIEKEKNIGSKD